MQLLEQVLADHVIVADFRNELLDAKRRLAIFEHKQERFLAVAFASCIRLGDHYFGFGNDNLVIDVILTTLVVRFRNEIVLIQKEVGVSDKRLCLTKKIICNFILRLFSVTVSNRILTNFVLCALINDTIQNQKSTFWKIDAN